MQCASKRPTTGEPMTVLRCDSFPLETSIEPGSNMVALFDRDGVLNIDHGYVANRENFQWIQGAKQCIVACQEAGFKIGIITNQSGIGRGYYTEQDFLGLMGWVAEEIEVEAVFYCPHSPEAKCDGRKPSPKMVLMSMQFLGADPAKTFFVGDKVSDIQAAERAGILPVPFAGGDLTEVVLPVIQRIIDLKSV